MTKVSDDSDRVPSRDSSGATVRLTPAPPALYSVVTLRLLAAAAAPCIAFGLFGPSATGFTFMKLGVGARPVAMGGAFTAVADDVNVLFWNPAGLALNSTFGADLTLMRLLPSVSYSSAGLVAPIGRRFGLGAAGGYLSASDTRRDEHGRELGTFGLSDFVIGPGFGWQPLKDLGIGLAARYVASAIDSFHAYAFSFDGGVMYQPVRYFTAGASLLHVGPPRKFITDWEYPPVNLRCGVAGYLPLAESHLLLTSDLSLYPDYGPTVSVGGELYIRLRTKSGGGSSEQGLAVRAGYQTGSHLGSWSGFSIGIGYDYAVATGLLLGVDVVYLTYGLLGGSERASLGLRFTPSRPARR